MQASLGPGEESSSLLEGHENSDYRRSISIERSHFQHRVCIRVKNDSSKDIALENNGHPIAVRVDWAAEPLEIPGAREASLREQDEIAGGC